jgi:membrane protease YdiL (CAAX protease family)
MLVPWLAVRGWSPRAVAGAPEPKDIAFGVGLWLLSLVLDAVVWATFGILRPETARALANYQPFAGGASAAATVLVSVINPVFEEFLWLGYAVPSLTPRLGVAGACAASIALRASVHSYQGPWALLSILPIALVLTAYYARTRRLWPAIVAHVIMDAVGLLRFLSDR